MSMCYYIAMTKMNWDRVKRENADTRVDKKAASPYTVPPIPRAERSLVRDGRDLVKNEPPEAEQSWVIRPASEKQIDLMTKHGMIYSIDTTCKQAYDIISSFAAANWK